MGNPAFFMDIQNEEDPELMFLTHQNISNCPSEAIDIADTLTKRYTQNRKAKNLPLNLKKCILNCGKNHPFQSLRFCPLAYTKTKEEILNILRKGNNKGCTNCLTPTMQNSKHNAQTCLLKKITCPICGKNHCLLMCEEGTLKDKLEKLNEKYGMRSII